MAGEVTDQQGFWSSLGDNEYTRGWSELVANVLRPVDRMVASEADLRSALAVRYGAGDAELRSGMLKGMGVEEVLDEAKALETVMAAAAQQGIQLTPEQAAQALFRDKLSVSADRAALSRGMDGYGPSLPVSGAGQAAYGVLGNAPVAYGLPAAGVGLAAWGVADVMRSQQQAAKESQLPLA
jgi:hypothetical protein